MIAFDTYWTFSYVLMLLFVFSTLWMLGIRFVSEGRAFERGWKMPTACVTLWAILGTHFFHCWW